MAIRSILAIFFIKPMSNEFTMLKQEHEIRNMAVQKLANQIDVSEHQGEVASHK